MLCRHDTKEKSERVELMKKNLVRVLSVIFALSMVITSFSACGKKDDKNTTEPTTQTTTKAETTTKPADNAVMVPEIILRQAFEEKGFDDWDGAYSSITDEMKQAASEYFAATGRTIEFRPDGAYLLRADGEDNTETESTDATEPVSDNSQSESKPSTSKPATGNQNLPGTKGVKVQSLTLSQKQVNVAKGSSVKVAVTVSPANAENKKVKWTSENPAVASVDANGNIVGVAEGLTIVTCTSESNPSVHTSCAVDVGSQLGGSLLSYQYDPDNQFFFTEDNPWQRNFGFNGVYDQFAPFSVMYMDSVRMKFRHEKQNLDYMIQFWKGQYGWVFVGSEIGIYTKPTNRLIEHYDCATDAQSLKMDMNFYQNGKWEFTRTYRTYWWATGFIPGQLKKFADRSSLVMTTRITLKDDQMTSAFVEALKGQGFKQVNISITSTTYDQFRVSGNDVYICWRYLDKPVNPIKTKRTTTTTTTQVTSENDTSTTQAE